MDETPTVPPTATPPEPISDIQRLNDLKMRVLNGEDIPEEQYLEVLMMVRKVRRSKGDVVEKPKKPKVDAAALLAGLGPSK